MQVAEIKSKLCRVCETNYTTHTAEVMTAKGTPISFPCCVSSKCRSVVSDLEFERDEMEHENTFLNKMRKAHLIPDYAARQFQSVKGRQIYTLEPSYKLKKKVAAKEAKTRTISNEEVFALVMAGLVDAE